MTRDDQIRREMGIPDWDWIVMPRVLAFLAWTGLALLVWRAWP